MTPQRFLVVRVAGQEFALPASRIRAMTQASGVVLTPLDGLGPLRYVVSIDGTTVHVTVPNAALGLPVRPICSRTCLLLIEGRADAILVDSVSRFEDVSSASIQSPSRVRLRRKWRTVLDPDHLVASAV